MICAHDEEYAHEYLHGNNKWNISRSVYVDDAHYVGDCTHWKHGVNTWTSTQAMVKVYKHMGTTIC